jgi:hypothetical protein
LGKRHFILAFERYYSWFSLCVPVSLVQFWFHWILNINLKLIRIIKRFSLPS